MISKHRTAGLIAISLLAAIAPSGKCILLKPDADLKDLDETKLTRLGFEVQTKATAHTIQAGEAVFEVLSLSGIKAGETGAYSVPAYNAAYRIALGVVRCSRFHQGPEGNTAEGQGEALTVSEFLTLPTAIQEAYLNELDKSDQPDQEDWDFFKKPASAGGRKSKNESSSEGKEVSTAS